MGVRIMQYSGLKIGDVKWAYSDSTGAIPFIINEKKTRVKHLDEGFVLEIRYGEPITMEQVQFLTDNYNKQMERQGKKEAKELAIQDAYSEEFVKTFNF